MELKELLEKTLSLFKIKKPEEIPTRLFECVFNNDTETYKQFVSMIKDDLNTDWLQKIFQYYLADRKDKKQDYTPSSLAILMGALINDDSDTIIDMCAGSGALTIQKWSRNPSLNFVLYEYDTNVLPVLLFNMVIRNINCHVIHADVLSDEIFKVYKIKKSEIFGVCKEEKYERFAII